MPNSSQGFISQIQLPNGNTYEIKDSVARQAMSGGLHLMGSADGIYVDNLLVAVEDMSSAATYKLKNDNTVYTAGNGDMIIYNSKEFVYTTSDNKWHEIGDNSDLGDLAYKDSVSATYKPKGQITGATFTGESKAVSVTGTPSGDVTISTGNGTPNYTPHGTVTLPTLNVELNTATKYVAASATGGGSSTPGTAAQCTLPSLAMSVGGDSGETLICTWTDGSWQANVPTSVTMPSFSSATVASGVKTQSYTNTASSTSVQIAGDPVELTASFSGDSLTSTGTYKSAGTITGLTFDGTQEPIVST